MHQGSCLPRWPQHRKHQLSRVSIEFHMGQGRRMVSVKQILERNHINKKQHFILKRNWPNIAFGSKQRRFEGGDKKCKLIFAPDTIKLSRRQEGGRSSGSISYNFITGPHKTVRENTSISSREDKTKRKVLDNSINISQYIAKQRGKQEEYISPMNQFRIRRKTMLMRKHSFGCVQKQHTSYLHHTRHKTLENLDDFSPWNDSTSTPQLDLGVQ